MTEKVKQLEDELETVDWYIRWERQGKTAKQILCEFDDLTRDKTRMQVELEEKDEKHQNEIEEWLEKV